MELKIKGTIVFNKNWNALQSPERFIINEGGSRSSKTVSLCQLVILYALQNPNKVISIVRKTFPSIRATVMRDFFEVMKGLNVYSKDRHNMTEHIYHFPNGSIVEFFSVDDEQKIRGRKRDLCWCNEANELWFEDFQQLNMRTEDKMIFDYNPSDSLSWLYDLPKEDSIVIKSTYKDNPFLPESIRKQIEDLKRTDEIMYQVYALGEKATSRENVYPQWELLKEKPERFTKFVYGLDFGYQHPTALIKVWYWENEIYLEEVVYQPLLTSTELIAKMNDKGVERTVEIIADNSRPEMINEIMNAGYYILKSNKGVKDGLTNVRKRKVYVSESALNIQKENKLYKYKKINGVITDAIDKVNDDAMDAIQYACTYLEQNAGVSYLSF